MPASGIDFYIQDARNNFDAVRPAPIPTDENVAMGQCQQNIHISTNCYYGYHDPKSYGNNSSNDCEMLEVTEKTGQHATARKRSADNADFPQSKRLRQAVPAASPALFEHLPIAMQNPHISKRTTGEVLMLPGAAAPVTIPGHPFTCGISHSEVQRENIEPETNESMDVEKNEDLLESLYWNTHGGCIFQLIQCS